MKVSANSRRISYCTYIIDIMYFTKIGVMDGISGGIMRSEK